MSWNHTDEHIDDGMAMMQVNLDDMSPEYCDYVMDLLFEAGAHDVYWIPIMMKKNRSGLMLNVLYDQKDRSKMEEILFKETTTLGVRYWPVSCHRLGRKFVEVDTPWGKVRVKEGVYQGDVVQYAPEYEECRSLAREAGIPLKKVYDQVRFNYELSQSQK